MFTIELVENWAVVVTITIIGAIITAMFSMRYARREKRLVHSKARMCYFLPFGELIILS